MSKRTVVIALALICLMTVVGMIGVRGWEGSDKASEGASGSPGCFDIQTHPIAARHTYLVNWCTGETWQLQRGSDDNLSWVPLKRYPTEALDLFEGLGDQ